MRWGYHRDSILTTTTSLRRQTGFGAKKRQLGPLWTEARLSLLRVYHALGERPLIPTLADEWLLRQEGFELRELAGPRDAPGVANSRSGREQQDRGSPDALHRPNSLENAEAGTRRRRSATCPKGNLVPGPARTVTPPEDAAPRLDDTNPQIEVERKSNCHLVLEVRSLAGCRGRKRAPCHLQISWDWKLRVRNYPCEVQNYKKARKRTLQRAAVDLETTR
ncbi:uncharacterized protein B0T15DRAFT_509235 [Chaetomium strumarium]|uniref:Uncharacterized protein n=1 Tax=Chaetomium strumarium TaxID=1170767 RepID=A0AAJ0GZ36_9PEZI|nr:hypothetical protein B0T15DRAFT_509235 [Chaetomium strumarium]